MTKSLYLVILAAGACAFSSCNTFIGLGRDVQSLGGGMVNTAHGKSWSGEPKPTTVPPVQQAAPVAPQPVR